MWGGGRRALWLALLLACTDHTVGHRSLLGSTNSPTKFAPTEFTPTEFTPTEFTPTEFTPTEAQASIDDVTPAPTQPHQLPPPATAGHSVFHSDDPTCKWFLVGYNNAVSINPPASPLPDVAEEYKHCLTHSSNSSLAPAATPPPAGVTGSPTHFAPSEFTPTEFTPTEFTPTEAQGSDATPAAIQHPQPSPPSAAYQEMHSDDPTCKWFLLGYNSAAASRRPGAPLPVVPEQYAHCVSFPTAQAPPPPSPRSPPAEMNPSPPPTPNSPTQGLHFTPWHPKSSSEAAVPNVTAACPVSTAAETTPLGCIAPPSATPPTCLAPDATHLSIDERLRNVARMATNSLLSIAAFFPGISLNEWRTCVDRAHSLGPKRQEQLRRKLRAALAADANQPERTFTVVFGGTSVTAGHDNAYEQAYPFQFERMVQCTFAAAGIQLKVRNAALGFNQALSYALCVDEFYGADADWVHWEMGALAGAQEDGAEAEVALRNFLDPSRFPRRPAFNYIHGAVSAKALWGTVPAACDSCPTSQQRYGKLCAVDGCIAEPCVRCPAAFREQYGPDGLSHDKIIALLDKYREFGTTMLEPLKCVAPLSDHFDFSGSKLIRAAKETGMNKGWHPGPYGHQLMAAMLAYRLLSDLKMEATNMMDSKPAKQGNNRRHRMVVEQWRTSQLQPNDYPPALPPPTVCPAVLCAAPSHCATTLEPRWRRTYLPEVRFDSTKLRTVAEDLPDDGAAVGRDDGARGVDDLLGWGTLLGEDSAPVHDMRNFCTPGSDCPKELSNPHGEVYDLNKVSVAVRRGMWVVGLMEFTREAVANGDPHGYVDRKYALMGAYQSDWLQLRFNGTAASTTLALCEGPCSNGNCPEYRARLRSDAEFMLDGEALVRPLLPAQAPLLEQGDTCVLLDVGRPITGAHTLGIRATTADKLLMLTNLVWF